ncbi:membrane-bound lytic murein transglycosylase F [Rhodoferax lithotrophicus]|uniref:Membrane-bound lytic murein transglycosylase F n=2 Tax=Rhodoferax lithotrophicus TaxID=2798804 RepID=A0ABN6DAG1_9BURK|nr:membrane-bound lytic murein transglycosylase F [Rhodoferax sp. MIZ03]
MCINNLHKTSLWRLSLLLVMLMFLNQMAVADVWTFIDETGRAHFANTQIDARYEVFFRDAAGSESAGGQTTGAENPATAPAGTSRVVTYFEISPQVKAVKHHLREAAQKQRIDLELLQAIIATESGFDPLVVSPKGAVGLMQLTPETALRFGVQADARTSIEKKLTDPHINIQAGSRYLAYLLALFPGEMELALAAYNAGVGAVMRAGRRIPNFQETQRYVKTVMQLYLALKPPAQLASRKADIRPGNGRIRVTMGGAVNRGNLPPMPVQPVPVDIFNF